VGSLHEAMAWCNTSDFDPSNVGFFSLTSAATEFEVRL
jgi:hypothetical protein